MPFMDAGFNKVIGILVYCMIKSTSKMIRKKRAFSIDSKRTEKGVINQNKINNYLPTKQLLPSPMR